MSVDNDNERLVFELLACPPHIKLLESGKVEPIEQCVICLRNERDELLQRLAQALNPTNDGFY